jgi:hypothetical protein
MKATPIRKWDELEGWERTLLMAVYGHPVDEYAEPDPQPVPHGHSQRVEGCFRCEISADEVKFK